MAKTIKIFVLLVEQQLELRPKEIEGESYSQMDRGPGDDYLAISKANPPKPDEGKSLVNKVS